MYQQGAEILEIEQQQPLFIGDAEGDIEDALLGIVELHHAREHERTHLRNGRTNGMTLLAE
jgi:hypothetical protein